MINQYSVVSTSDGTTLEVNEKYIGTFDTSEEAWAALRGIKEFVRMFGININNIIERDAIGKVRLWKLGSLEHNIIPKQEAFDRFVEELQKVPNDGTPTDIVWNPAISCEIIN
jgi:hypothetical protein